MVACRISQQLLPQLEEADMNDLLTWFSEQHHGLGTFRIFQRKLEDLLENEPEHRALYRLLSNVVGRYIDVFDEALAGRRRGPCSSVPARFGGKSQSSSEHGLPAGRSQSCCGLRGLALNRATDGAHDSILGHGRSGRCFRGINFRNSGRHESIATIFARVMHKSA
jgi:hypothetical protein